MLLTRLPRSQSLSPAWAPLIPPWRYAYKSHRHSSNTSRPHPEATSIDDANSSSDRRPDSSNEASRPTTAPSAKQAGLFTRQPKEQSLSKRSPFRPPTFGPSSRARATTEDAVPQKAFSDADLTQVLNSSGKYSTSSKYRASNTGTGLQEDPLPSYNRGSRSGEALDAPMRLFAAASRSSRERALGLRRLLSAGDETRSPRVATERQTRSLLDELFPEDSKRTKLLIKRIGGGRNPLPDQELEWARAPALDGGQVLEGLGDHSNFSTPHVDSLEARQRKSATVLLFSNASKALSESDFLRIAPKGDHIEGWNSGLIKVIPGRDKYTLEHLGYYMLLFSSFAAARHYHDQVRRLHQISRAYNPRSFSAPIAPPPGFIRDGDDIHALMEAFTLVPASTHEVAMRLMKRPYQPYMDDVLTGGGPPALAERLRVCPNLVLLSLDDGSVSTYELNDLIGADGRRRGHLWQLFGSNQDIKRLDASPDDQAGVDGSEVPSAGRRKRAMQQRFILSFKDQLEAKRFVRDWHRQPLGVKTQQEELSSVVNAELLW